jgi:hypothetical protein
MMAPLAFRPRPRPSSFIPESMTPRCHSSGPGQVGGTRSRSDAALEWRSARFDYPFEKTVKRGHFGTRRVAVTRLTAILILGIPAAYDFDDETLSRLSPRRPGALPRVRPRGSTAAPSFPIPIPCLLARTPDRASNSIKENSVGSPVSDRPGAQLGRRFPRPTTQNAPPRNPCHVGATCA